MKTKLLPALSVAVIILAPLATQAALLWTTNIIGGAFNGNEQVSEANAISSALSSYGYNGGVSGSSSYRNSYYRFSATGGAFFTLDGASLGSNITIVHKQDWIGVATNLCASQDPSYGWLEGNIVHDSDCNYYATWGQSYRTLGINSPAAPPPPPPPGASCSANGVNYWPNAAGPCSANVNTTAADGATVTNTNTAPGYVGSIQWTCSNGTWTGPYNMSCTASGSVSASVTVTVAPGLILTAFPTSVAYAGSSNLSWSSTNADSCTMSVNGAGARAVMTSYANWNTGGLTSDTTYAITCTGLGGSVTRSVTVSVAAQPTCGNGAINYAACNQCANGSAYIGASCVACSNGGCSGTGGNASSPLGGLVCNNSTSNPTTCNASCTPSYSCVGNNLYYTDATCTQTLSQTCSYRCAGSACIAPPAISFVPFAATNATFGPFTASGHLQMKPQLLWSGDRTTLYWNVSNAQSCTVTGGNGDSWSGLFSGSSGKTSSPIVSQTTYTLTCAALPGSTPVSVSETATVNIIPVFQEK